jgi:hypothetical protein
MAWTGTNLIFSRLPFNPEMHDALTALHILHAQITKLLAADTVIKKRGQDRAIAHALQRIFGWRFQQRSRLRIAERRRAAFVAVGQGPLNAIDRIAGDGISFAQVIEQRRQRGGFSPDAGRRQ